MVLPGEIRNGRLSVAVDDDELLAIKGALAWLERLAGEQLASLLWLGQLECGRLIERLQRAEPDAPVPLTRTELLSVQLALALAADGPLATDIEQLAVEEQAYRRCITALSAILQLWIRGDLPDVPRELMAPFVESDIPMLARSVAAQKRDPLPELIQHSAGPREQATKVMSDGGSVVHGDDPSYLVAIRGRFSGPARTRLSAPEPPPIVQWTVQLLVLDAGSGGITDAGGGDSYPDLSLLGAVTTDYQRDRDGEHQPAG